MTYEWFKLPWITVVLALATGFAQVPPDAGYPDLNPEALTLTCPVPEPFPDETEAQRRQREAYAAYAEVLALYFAKVPAEPDETLLVPVDGVRVADIVDTFGAPRGSGRTHAGIDIFAPRGTPVRSATGGFVWAVEGVSPLGGNAVTVVGAGGRRYYYSHLDRFADNLREGQPVTPDTVLGYVGTSGNAEATPPHLHFEFADGFSCDWNVVNPYPLLADR